MGKGIMSTFKIQSKDVRVIGEYLLNGKVKVFGDFL